jgi:GH24 family phage-related lysozyme (muramidase)
MTDPLHECVTNIDPNSNVNIYTTRYCKPRKISDDGVSFIAVWESGTLNGKYAGRDVVEGFILTAYLDNVGIPTVGCGHRILQSDHIKVGDTITLDRAREFKRKAINEVEGKINTDLNVPLFQFEYDALCSIIYNCGTGDGAKGILKKFNTGDHIHGNVFDYVSKYRVGTNKGVAHRRFAEARLFETGVYDASH